MTQDERQCDRPYLAAAAQVDLLYSWRMALIIFTFVRMIWLAEDSRPSSLPLRPWKPGPRSLLLGLGDAQSSTDGGESCHHFLSGAGHLNAR
jgi:hypothetical protein